MQSEKKLRVYTAWNRSAISFQFAVTPCAYLNYREAEITGYEKNLIAQLVSRLSLSEIMVQERTNIGHLVSQLSLS